jgi:hypothetical protein
MFYLLTYIAMYYFAAVLVIAVSSVADRPALLFIMLLPCKVCWCCVYLNCEYDLEYPCEFVKPWVAYLFAFISSHVPFFSSSHMALYITLTVMKRNASFTCCDVK